jgi:hypothetical protein
MEKLARIVTGVFEARHSHVGAKRCYWSKMSKGGFIKVTIGIAESMRMDDTFRSLSNGRKGWEGLPRDSEGFKVTSGLYPHNWGVKGITF